MNDISWLIRHHIETAPTASFNAESSSPAKISSALKSASKRAVEILSVTTEGQSRPRALVAGLQKASFQLADEAISAPSPMSLALTAQADSLAQMSLDLLTPGEPRRQANRVFRELIADHLKAGADMDTSAIERVKLRLDDPALLVAARQEWFNSKTAKTRFKHALQHFTPVAA